MDAADTARLDEVRERLGRVSDPVGLLEGIFAYAPFGLQVYRADGHCLLTNQAFRDLFGSEPPPDYNVLNDEIAERTGILGLVRRAFAGETVHTPPVWYDPRELRQVRVTEGRRVAMSATFFPLFGRSGAVEHVAIVFKDETAEVLARERVEAGERLLRQMIDDTQDAVFVKGRDGRYVVVNAAAAAVAGRPVAEILGRTDDEVFPPEEARRLRQSDLAILESGASVTYDESFNIGGETRHFSTAKAPQRDADGRAVGVIGITRDITARKRAEEALERLALENRRLLERARAEERWLEMILDRLPTPLVFVEPGSARLFFANAAANRMAGGTLARPATPEDHARFFDVRDLGDRPLAAGDIPAVRAARGAELAGVQVRWHLPGGTKVFAAHSARLPAEHGHPETVLVVFDDITALKAVQAELEEAVRVRQDFLSIAGHELKTPLTSLLLNARAVDKPLRALAFGDRFVARWQALQRQLVRLDTLVDQLLDVSRLTAGKLVLQAEPLDVAEVAREVVARFPPSGETPPIIVEAAAAVPGRWDRLRLEQVITNLVSNAVKYGEGRPVDVVVRGARGEATIMVRDRGIGIAPEALARIFDRFERAASARHYGGLGLGLWIVSQLVRAMGGTIEVDSAPARGSTFTVRLPVVTETGGAVEGERDGSCLDENRP